MLLLESKMARKKETIGDIIIEGLVPIAMMGLLYLFYQYFYNRGNFWKLSLYFLLVVIVVISAVILFVFLKSKKKQKLIEEIGQKGLDSDINNFISRFGNSGAKKKDWQFRGYGFDSERLDDFKKILKEKGLSVPLNNSSDIFEILKYYIQKMEERVTQESIKNPPKAFFEISGEEFETLLFRLFSAMGYVTQRTGKAGDQGCDLILNKDGQRIIVQAKRYTGSVNNEAVQQAVAAKKYYDCNRVMVVTNSTFNKSAYDLAKVNDVELVGGNQLRGLLLRNLGESWN